MTEDEAIQLLFTLLNTTENKTNRIAATDIVRRLGYLPLAIDQAGSYMKNGGIALADFLGYYEQSAKDVLESVPNLWEYYESAISESEKCTTNITAKTVFTTWNLSFTSLKPDTPEGALKVTFLSLLAFFNEHVISEEFFEVYYSANRLSQQPEWMSLFIDDDGLWSCRKFDGVMRSFLRLSLITSLNTDRVDTKYAFVTFHPLVRDWINLRQERSTHKANFTTFTGILASYISATFWEDSVWIYGFRISADQRRRLAGHLARWMEVFKFHKSSLQPTILAAEYEQNVTTITAEQLIAKLFYQLDQRNNSFELSQWLWESCDISDRRMVRVKFDAGNQQVLCQNTADETRNKSRELLEYWKSVLGADHSRDYMLIESHFVLIASLANSVHAVDKEECIDICKAELERLPYGEENMSLRHRILNELAYAAYWSYQRDVCKKTIEIMLDETEGRGGDNFRKKIWSQRVWEIILIIVTDRFYDLRLADRLSLVALESAKEKHGINQINVGRSYLLRARVLANMGRFVEAESLTRDCIVSGQLNRDVYILSHRVLGDILRGQGKFEEAYANYNSVLFLMQKFQVRNTTLVLLYKCGEVATAFNARLADTHYTMMLSLAKKVGDWDILVCGVTELYRVKATIGTKGAKKDALELLVEGLTVYGINFVCKSDTQRAPLRETHTTIHLGQLESSQYSAQGEMVRKALMVKFAGSSRSGINFLIWLAVELLEATDVNAAEHAFRLARYVFDKSMGFNEYEILRTMKHIFRYAKLRYAVDKDQQKVRDILDWAQTDIRKRIGHMVENREDWWESQTTPLLDLIETPAQRAKRQYSKAKKKISHRFSSIMR
ncbi:hypothetical protein F4806DRAFT_454912 [Annulohypoxylon nitens]|nr:hypothetical protein F4806DRAFT_454912 [Annulohypoxylon nitens]